MPSQITLNNLLKLNYIKKEKIGHNESQKRQLTIDYFFKPVYKNSLSKFSSSPFSSKASNDEDVKPDLKPRGITDYAVGMFSQNSVNSLSGSASASSVINIDDDSDEDVDEKDDDDIIFISQISRSIKPNKNKRKSSALSVKNRIKKPRVFEKNQSPARKRKSANENVGTSKRKKVLSKDSSSPKVSKSRYSGLSTTIKPAVISSNGRRYCTKNIEKNSTDTSDVDGNVRINNSTYTKWKDKSPQHKDIVNATLSHNDSEKFSNIPDTVTDNSKAPARNSVIKFAVSPKNDLKNPAKQAPELNCVINLNVYYKDIKGSSKTSVETVSASGGMPSVSNKTPESSSKTSSALKKTPSTLSKMPNASNISPMTSSKKSSTSNKTPTTSSKTLNTSGETTNTSVKTINTSVKTINTSGKIINTSGKATNNSDKAPDSFGPSDINKSFGAQSVKQGGNTKVSLQNKNSNKSGRDFKNSNNNNMLHKDCHKVSNITTVQQDVNSRVSVLFANASKLYCKSDSGYSSPLLQKGIGKTVTPEINSNADKLKIDPKLLCKSPLKDGKGSKVLKVDSETLDRKPDQLQKKTVTSNTCPKHSGINLSHSNSNKQSPVDLHKEHGKMDGAATGLDKSSNSSNKKNRNRVLYSDFKKSETNSGVKGSIFKDSDRVIEIVTSDSENESNAGSIEFRSKEAKKPSIRCKDVQELIHWKSDIDIGQASKDPVVGNNIKNTCLPSTSKASHDNKVSISWFEGVQIVETKEEVIDLVSADSNSSFVEDKLPASKLCTDKIISDYAHNTKQNTKKIASSSRSGKVISNNTLNKKQQLNARKLSVSSSCVEKPLSDHVSNIKQLLNAENNGVNRRDAAAKEPDLGSIKSETDHSYKAILDNIQNVNVKSEGGIDYKNVLPTSSLQENIIPGNMKPSVSSEAFSPKNQTSPLKSASPSTSPAKRLMRKYIRKTTKVSRRLNMSDSLTSTPESDNSKSKKMISGVPSYRNSGNIMDVYFYYFTHILIEILTKHPSCDISNGELHNCLSNGELHVVNIFNTLSKEAKKLYIRLLSRKYDWHRRSQINYSEISSDLTPYFQELRNIDFITYDYSNEHLNKLLSMLKNPELRILLKNFNLQPSVNKKDAYIHDILKYARTQTTIQGDSHNIVKRSVTRKLGKCLKLCEIPRNILLRMFLIYCLPFSVPGELELLPVLLMMQSVDDGHTKYCKYNMSFNTVSLPYLRRDNIIRFHESRDLQNRFMDFVTNKNWKDAEDATCKAYQCFLQVLNNEAQSNSAKELPLFLRKFMAGSVYAHIITEGADILKKNADLYKEVALLLETLLNQDIYLLHYRGTWYNKLSLLLHHHLHDHLKAAEVIMKALRDEHVSEIERYILTSRGYKIHDAKKSNLTKDARRKLYHILEEETELSNPPVVTINGKSLSSNRPGAKRVFIQEDADEGAVTYSSVEEFALSYYQKNGYIRGQHFENTIVVSLFGLLFWDVIYETVIPDVFQSVYQTKPLDLNYKDFYLNRKQLIDEKITSMKLMTIEELQHLVTERFTLHCGTESIVNWMALESAENISTLISCLTPDLIVSICERLVKNYRATKSGFPDLVVWSPVTSKCKFVEVKSPKDTLSDNQKLWLHYLIQAGADAEVCQVRTIASQAGKIKARANATKTAETNGKENT